MAFSQDYLIDYMFINQDLSSNFVGLAGKVQETSLLHSLSSGYSMDWFLKEQCGFILTGWNVQVMEYPKWGERIQISTWASNFKNMLAYRSFAGRDASGKTILLADSDWVLMNFRDKKPLRIPQDMHENYGPMSQAAIGQKIRLPEAADYKPLCEGIHKVTRKDIDTNHHVNNISYISWAMDAMPDDYYFSHEPGQVMVKYHKESRLGEELSINISSKGDCFITYINALADGALRCSIYSKWREKSRISI